MPDYSLSKIYKLVSNKTSDIYIGSCLMRLSTRLSNHKKKTNDCSSKKLFVDDAIITIVLIENFACNTKNELKARELFHITANNCINVNKPFVCEIPYGDGKAWQKEYYQANAEQIITKHKEYNQANADQISTRKKEYYLANTEQIIAQHKEYCKTHIDQINANRRARYAKNKLSQNLQNNLNKNIIV